MLDCLNEIRKAEWRDGVLTLMLPVKTSRKFRRATQNRRWEKKFCRYMQRAGIPLMHVNRAKG
jgi:hypothetical protein